MKTNSTCCSAVQRISRRRRRRRRVIQATTDCSSAQADTDTQRRIHTQQIEYKCVCVTVPSSRLFFSGRPKGSSILAARCISVSTERRSRTHRARLNASKKAVNAPRFATCVCFTINIRAGHDFFLYRCRRHQVTITHLYIY